MDIATFSGIVVFLGFVLGAVYLQEGLAGFKPFLNAEAFMLVMGGTACALLVNFPLSSVINSGKVLMKVMRSKGEDTSKLVSTFVALSQKAKKEGFLALEADVKAIDNDFLKRGVQLVIDGSDHEFIRNMLETEIDFIRERHKAGREIFNALGTYAPAFGIIGTVLGMILMLSSIDDVAQVPRRMALALAAAFFGLASGYWLFMPIGGKLKHRSDEELFVKEIIIRGVLLLQSGATPSVVEANLKAYLDPAARKAIKKEPAAA
ncbi:MAG: MotA/TolQ/ExbB proton channel family protein [Elusimicrobia bacterium]|jgi:chemotaxis protein MotA|nr:MotA/TolQ/ExbB proton channel family protein [Elusimicrobiota bacterium]